MHVLFLDNTDTVEASVKKLGEHLIQISGAEVNLSGFHLLNDAGSVFGKYDGFKTLYDGNAASAKTVSFTVDTIPPTLTLTNPVDGLITNKAALVVSGKTDDVTSKPVTVTVNGTSVTVNSDGSFSKEITLVSGSNTITVVATDKAGKTTTVTRKVTLDTGAPVFEKVTLTPNPVDCGKTFVISVKVTD